MTDKTLRSCWWSVTTFDEKEYEEIRKWQDTGIMPSMIKVIWGGLEETAEGRVHFQGCFNTAQCRLSALKVILPTSHFEVARKIEALKKYAMKTHTAIEVKREKKNDSFVDMAALLRMLGKEYEENYDDIVDNAEWMKDGGFRYCANKIYAKREDLCGLLSQPQVARAWTLFGRTACMLVRNAPPIVLQEVQSCTIESPLNSILPGPTVWPGEEGGTQPGQEE